MNSTINSETPAMVLVQSMARAGWGELGGNEWQGVRSTLTAIVARTRGRRGYMDATVWQVSQSAGLSTRWTARCLRILEGLGIITWNRGALQDGTPMAGFIQVNKPILLRFVREAWAKGAAAWQARRAETRARLADLKKRESNNRRSRRVELSTPLNNNLARRAFGAGGAPNIEPAKEPPAWATGKEEEPMNEGDCPLCDHGHVKDSGTCPHCRRIQDSRKDEKARKPWTKERRKAWRNATARRVQQDLERLTAEEHRRTSELWRREHPGVNSFDWLRQQLEADRAGVRA